MRQNIHTISANIVRIMNLNLNPEIESYKSEIELVKAHLIDNGLTLLHYIVDGFENGLDYLIIEDINNKSDFEKACDYAFELLLEYVADYQPEPDRNEGLCHNDF
jgi:hypothetical protein